MTLTLDQWEIRLRSVNRHLPALALEVVDAAARAGVKHATSVVPVDTGRLRASIGVGEISTSPSGAEATFEARTSYAAFVESGTVNHGPQPYMRPAAAVLTPGFKRGAEVIGVEALTRSLT